MKVSELAVNDRLQWLVVFGYLHDLIIVTEPVHHRRRIPSEGKFHVHPTAPSTTLSRCRNESVRREFFTALHIRLSSHLIGIEFVGNPLVNFVADRTRN